jgi:peptide deformylase
VGLRQIFGSGTSMVSLESLQQADCVVLVGSNAPANHPRLMNELIRLRERGGSVLVINPVLETSAIPETMPDPELDDEGCLSVPGESFPCGRAEWAQVTGLDANGDPVTLEGTGLFARMLQHETGHLDGFLYVDKLIGRHARAAKRTAKSHGWGVPGASWMPGEVPDPFGN